MHFEFTIILRTIHLVHHLLFYFVTSRFVYSFDLAKGVSTLLAIDKFGITNYLSVKIVSRREIDKPTRSSVQNQLLFLLQAGKQKYGRAYVGTSKIN